MYGKCIKGASKLSDRQSKGKDDPIKSPRELLKAECGKISDPSNKKRSTGSSFEIEEDTVVKEQNIQDSATEKRDVNAVTSTIYENDNMNADADLPHAKRAGSDEISGASGNNDIESVAADSGKPAIQKRSPMVFGADDPLYDYVVNLRRWQEEADNQVTSSDETDGDA